MKMLNIDMHDAGRFGFLQWRGDIGHGLWWAGGLSSFGAFLRKE